MRKLFVVLSLLLSTAAFGATAPATLKSYAYVSPEAQVALKRAAVTDKELIAFVDGELQRRALQGVEAGRLYEDAEDSVRIDIRAKGKALTVELSVRQGASIHNMLERWQASRVLKIEGKVPSRQLLLDTLTWLLDDLQKNYNSPAYKRGKMMMDD